jgi:hypothetical protein
MAEHARTPADRVFGPDQEEVDALKAAAKIDRDRSSIEQGRRVAGLPGAMMAGAMIALRDIYEGPKRDDGVVTVDAPSEPHDVDRDGLELRADEVGGDDDVAIPAQPRLQPVVSARRRPRRRR